MSNGRTARNASYLVVLALGCAPAPAPPAPAPVNAPQFCVDRQRRQCLRDYLAARITQAQYETCVDSIEDLCRGASWAAGCAPSVVVADACLSALEDMERLDQSTDRIVECQSATLCRGAPLVSPTDDGV